MQSSQRSQHENREEDSNGFVLQKGERGDVSPLVHSPLNRRGKHQQADTRRSPGLRENLRHHMARDISQAVVSTGVAVGEAFMVDAE